MVNVSVKDGKVQSVELQIGERTVGIPLREPLDREAIADFEEIEARINKMTGQNPESPLHQLWEQSSEYERVFLNLLATKDEVRVADVLAVYQTRGLKHGTGRILAGVTGGVRKKLYWYTIEDLYKSDYDDAGERVWTLNEKYTAEARTNFKW